MKHSLTFRVIAFATVLLAVGRSGGAQTGSQLFQEALTRERAEGKLDEAIALYQRILREHAGEHALAAKTLMQLGRAYERMGKTEARKAYERVLREYADQPDAVKEARDRITALESGDGIAQQGQTGGATARRLLTKTLADVVMPDGRSLLGSDSTGNLAMWDIRTGRSTQLTHTKSDFDEFVDRYSASDDSRLIAYAWWNGPKDQWELRVVDRTSGVERVLISDTTLGYIRPYAFTHDAKFVVAGVSPAGAGASSLSLISVSTGARQSVVTYQGRDPQNAALSPDGRFLVYDVRDESSETNNRDIHIVSMSTHADTVLVHHPAADLAPSWSPRGEGVFFVSNRSGAPAGWYVPVQNGRATDSPRQVFQNFGTAAGLLGLTRDGALYYAPARANRRELYLADFDAAALAVIGQPQPLVSRTSGASEFPSWSADGKSLIYSAGSGADHVVRVRNAQTGSESETRTSAIRATLVTDSVAVINDAGRGGAPIRLSRLDLRTGKSDVLVERPDSGYNVSRFETSLGGKVLYYLLWKGARHTSLMRYDLDSKSEREIYQSGDRMTTDFSVSPDGRQLAIVEDDRQGKRPGQRVRLLRVDGDASTDRLLGHTEPGGNIAGWLPGGRGLIVFVPRNGARELWLVPTDATSPRKLSASLPSGTAEVRLSPDGRRLVLRVDDYTREIWIAEHFLPSGGK